MAKQDIIITLDLGEIAWEVQDKTHLAGRMARDTGAGAATASDMQLTDDPERRVLLERSIGVGVARLRRLLHEWTTGGAAANNGIRINDPVVLTLHMPTNFALAATDDLAACCHRYVVYAALADWWDSVDKSRAPDCYRQADAQSALLMEAAHSRQRPARRQYCGCGGGITTEDYLWHDELLWDDDQLWLED